jgi:2-keto-4-pentenoate hydratase/2-oxohepta-3-ene-1,7-dioic acid hydratase in catechol pathway
VRLVTIESQTGPAVGAVTPEGVLDLTAAWAVLRDRPDAPPASMPDLIARQARGPSLSDRLAEAGDELRPYLRPEAETRLRAPLPSPGKLICAASNYAAHIQESGREPPPDKRAITPWLFLKPVTCIIGPDDPIPLPRDGQAIDWEVELAAVIGRPGRRIPADRALEHVFGYTILNDVSERRFKVPAARPARDWDRFFDWLHGKWFDGFAPMGPWLVTADEIGDPQALELELRVNGQTRQRGNTAHMIYSVADLVSFASSIMMLLPGDIIATGTPQGVGIATGESLKPGDFVECEVQGVGLLTNPVVAEDEAVRSGR